MFKIRVIVALLSTIVFSLIWACLDYTPVSERLPDVSYGSFFSPIPFLIMITGVPYILGGIPVSMLLDKYVDKLIVKFLLYLMGGYIVGVITLMVSFWTFGLQLLLLGLFGAAGSLIFFILLSLINRLYLIK